MLKILNDLSFFFEDNYRDIHVRAYAKIKRISPPTASALLEHYCKEGLLLKETDKRHNLYKANRENPLFRHLQRAYWQDRLTPLLAFIEKEYLNPVVILFGSASKAEITEESDIDLAVFTPTEKELNLEDFSRSLKRPIQLFRFDDQKSVKNPHLLANILRATPLLRHL